MTDSSTTTTASDGGWYYTQSGARMGPVAAPELRQLLTDNKINGDTPVWRAGLGGDWKPLRDTEFGILLADTPPPVDPSQIGNGFVWTVAVIPLIYGLLRGILIGAADETGSETLAQWVLVAWVFAALFTLALTVLDERRLVEAGRGGKWLLAWAIILVPVYLFVRAHRLKQTPTYALAWIASAFVGAYIS